MPNWNQILQEIQNEIIATQQSSQVTPIDKVRRKYIQKLFQYRKRNVICYYSGWLNRQFKDGVSINDWDMNGFMSTIHGLDRTKGLDLILHTPGGEIAATESIVKYLKKMFADDIEVFIPHLAMSAGTMIACSSKKIYMGKQSSLGPIDPQMQGVPMRGALIEYQQILEDARISPYKIPILQELVRKYPVSFILQCEYVVDWSKKIVTDWLKESMFKTSSDPLKLANDVVEKLSDVELMKAHNRHLSKDECKQVGLTIVDLEDNQELQDLILTIHHTYMHTFSNSTASKIIENQADAAVVIFGPAAN